VVGIVPVIVTYADEEEHSHDVWRHDLTGL
jgi:hypothetical protein